MILVSLSINYYGGNDIGLEAHWYPTDFNFEKNHLCGPGQVIATRARSSSLRSRSAANMTHQNLPRPLAPSRATSSPCEASYMIRISCRTPPQTKWGRRGERGRGRGSAGNGVVLRSFILFTNPIKYYQQKGSFPALDGTTFKCMFLDSLLSYRDCSTTKP